jgi:hypothetical protein
MNKPTDEFEHATMVPAQDQGAAYTPSEAVMVDRIEHAIHIVADVMVKHDIDLMPTIRRLEAERDKLRQKTVGMDYAKEILRKRAQHGMQHRQAHANLSY